MSGALSDWYVTVPRPRHVVWPHEYALRCLWTPIERIGSIRPALRFRVLGGETDTDEREVVRQMGGASRADRYRLLVGESGVEGVGVGLLPDDQVHHPSKVQNVPEWFSASC
jgi:hypothetical protein